MFVWGAKVFFNMYRPPAGAMEIYVVGKQWMWKAQHMDGQREINELHVPVGRPVKLIMASEDVIHSFFIPAFRVKADVVPGRYNMLWFTASQAGHVSPVLRAVLRHEALGDDRLGRSRWSRPTSRPGSAAGNAADTPAAAGEKLFADLACITCHRDDAQGARPQLKGAFGTHRAAAKAARPRSSTKRTSASRS